MDVHTRISYFVQTLTIGMSGDATESYYIQYSPVWERDCSIHTSMYCLSVYHTNSKLVEYGIRYSPSLSVNKVEEEAHYSKYDPNQ